MTDEKEKTLADENGTETSTGRRSFLSKLSAVSILGIAPGMLLSGTASANKNSGSNAGKDAKTYHLSGYYFESCNCDGICPCLLLDDPTHGYCQAFPAWHIEEGYLGEVELSGLNVAAWLYSPGNLVDGDWRLALYIDERADEQQRQALTELWQGKHGGYLETIASLVGELMGVSSARIDMQTDGNLRTMQVEGVGGVEIAAIEGPNGSTVTVSDTPLAVAPGYPITVHRSKEWSYNDHGYSVQFTGTSGLSSKFTYYA